MTDASERSLVDQLRNTFEDAELARHPELIHSLCAEAATRLAEAEAENGRLREALQEAGDSLNAAALIAPHAAAQRQLLDAGSKVRAALTDTASAPETNSHDADMNPDISHATDAALQTLADEGQKDDAAPSAGDVRRRALEEAKLVAVAAAARWKSQPGTTVYEVAALKIAEELDALISKDIPASIATPATPTVEAARDDLAPLEVTLLRVAAGKETVEWGAWVSACMEGLWSKGLIEGESNLTLTENGRRALSQQEGGK